MIACDRDAVKPRLISSCKRRRPVSYEQIEDDVCRTALVGSAVAGARYRRGEPDIMVVSGPEVGRPGSGTSS